MGNWAVTIIGTGAHHNKGYREGQENFEGDANQILKETVEKLKAVGQNVEHASFTHGGRDVLTDNVGYYPPVK